LDRMSSFCISIARSRSSSSAGASSTATMLTSEAAIYSTSIVSSVTS
jgi:hypothetical protein